MWKILAHWIVAALGFLATAQIVPGFVVDNFPAALVAALVLGVLNLIVWPIFALLTLPLTILTFGLFLFVLNALILKLGALITPGFEVHGFWPAVFGSLVISFLGALVRLIFSEPEAQE